MLERVAEAQYTWLRDHDGAALPPWSKITAGDRDFMGRQVRAGLEAMFPATEAMVEAAGAYPNASPGALWQIMIDAILAEVPK